MSHFANIFRNSNQLEVQYVKVPKSLDAGAHPLKARFFNHQSMNDQAQALLIGGGISSMPDPFIFNFAYVFLFSMINTRWYCAASD
jgi:hypothetical protein